MCFYEHTRIVFDYELIVVALVLSTVHSLRRDLRVRTMKTNDNQTLSATDVLAPTTMKNAAKCDTSCELQNPVSHQNFERTLHFPWEVCLLECLSIPTQEWLYPIHSWESAVSSTRAWDVIELGFSFRREGDASLHSLRWIPKTKARRCFNLYEWNESHLLFFPAVWEWSNCGHHSMSLKIRTIHPIGPPISQEYPLNLSI